MRPKVIPNDQETTSGTHSSRVSPESGTYGALGPLPGRVITKENMMITPEGYKEKKPKDPTIAEKFNTYRFADYKDKVIDLLMRVCSVSVRTMEIIGEMREIKIVEGECGDGR